MKAHIARISGLKSAAETLRGIQLAQRVHDDKFHPEIARLDLDRRVTHMVLHLTKYAGGMASASGAKDSQLFERNVIDAAIISVSASTALQNDIAKSLSAEGWDINQSLAELCSSFIVASSDVGFLDAYVIEVGRLAKATEAIDHVEAYPIRDEWTRGFTSVFKIVAAEATRRHMELPSAIVSRLTGVRRSNIFYNEIMAEIPSGILE